MVQSRENEIQPLKCEFLTIINKVSPVKFTYHVSIKEVEFVKYLGVVIDSKLNWKEHVKQVLCKATCILT